MFGIVSSIRWNGSRWIEQVENGFGSERFTTGMSHGSSSANGLALSSGIGGFVRLVLS